MFSARKAGLRLALVGIAAAGALTATGAAQAQSVVVRSTGPSAAQFPQGKRLPAKAKVTLKGGDRLTIVDKAGTRVLAGPGSFTLDGTLSNDQGAATRVGGILSGGTNPRMRTGAVRGAPPGALSGGPDNVWYIDVTKGGKYCVANPNSVMLWRPNREMAAEAKLTATSGGRMAKVTWPKGSSLKAWPTAQLPVTDGSTYVFSDPVGPTVTIVTHVLPALPNDQVEVAGLLGDRGCMAQLDVLANAATPGAPSGG